MPISSRPLCVATAVALCVAFSSAAFAQPSISTTAPLGIQPGKATDVKVRGGGLAGVVQLWTSFEAQSARKSDGKNAGEAVFGITVPADATVGIKGVRVAGPGGVSALKLFMVDDLPSVDQKAGNTNPAAAQEIPALTAVDGAVGSLSRHYFKIKAAAGQQLSFEVVARRLGSALDPTLRLLDAKGKELAYSDDDSGLRADCQFSYKFAAAGDYFLELRDIRYQGGANHFFRLRVGDFPCVQTPYPHAIKRGSSATVSFGGKNIEGVQPVKLEVAGDYPLDWINVGAKRAGGKSSGFVSLAVSTTNEAVEAEPNDEQAKATRVNLGDSVNGRIDKKGDADRFVFTAKKGQNFTFRGVTRSQGSPASLFLRLLKADGATVATVEDYGIADSVIKYAFPADGDYTLLVQGLHRKASSAHTYRIEALPTASDFELQASADRFNIGAGGTAMLTVTSKRNGYNGPIVLEATGLPKGVHSVPTVLGPGVNSVVMTIRSDADAATNQVFPANIVGKAKIGNADYQATALVSTALKAQFNALPFPPQEVAEAFAVGVGPKPQIRLRVEPPQAVFGRDLKATVKVIAEREKGFDEAIALAITPAKNGVPGGVTIAVKPIPKGQNSVDIVISGNNKVPIGNFSAALTGTIKQGKTTVVQPIGVGLKLDQPMSLSASVQGDKLARGGKITLKVSVNRNPALKAPIALTLQNLPKGVTAAAATVPADKNEVEIILNAGQDAAQGTVSNITVKADATVAKAKYTANSAAVKLTVE
ncbi:MAG: hypothetical protein CMJ78_05655 [Planctomycetaceae bacterium]|nr:hypothetical protein [Planctomycetaceae bacterium]